MTPQQADGGLFALCENDSECWTVDRRTAGLVYHTAKYGCAEVLSALLELELGGSAIREVNEEWCPPSALYWAAKNGHRSFVALLIKKTGAALEHKSRDDGTTLTAAVDGGHEATLDAVETAAADRIHHMLEGAGAWGRRGWLIMMRARRAVASEILGEPSSKKPLSPERIPPMNDVDANEREDGEACIALEGLNLADAPSTDAPGGLDEQERNAVLSQAIFSGGGVDNSEKQVGTSATGSRGGVAPAVAR
eukprot:g14747.t1